MMLFGFQGLLDIIRGRVLVRIAGVDRQTLSARIYDLAAKLPLRALGADWLSALARSRSHPLLHVERRAGGAVRPAVDAALSRHLLPLPSLIGIAATVGGLILVAITVATEFLTRRPARETSGLADSRMALAEASRRNAEVVQAMGMGRRLATLWQEHNRRYLAAQQRVGRYRRADWRRCRGSCA